MQTIIIKNFSASIVYFTVDPQTFESVWENDSAHIPFSLYHFCYGVRVFLPCMAKCVTSGIKAPNSLCLLVYCTWSQIQKNTFSTKTVVTGDFSVYRLGNQHTCRKVREENIPQNGSWLCNNQCNFNNT